MSSYTHLVDKQHSDWLSSVVVPKKEEPKTKEIEGQGEKVSLPTPPPLAREDSPINQDPLPVPSIMIPSISCASLEVVKQSNLSKQMKKRILELPNEMLDQTEAIEEVVYLVENKKTLKKALDLVFKIEE
jgi:hypothetical protein